MPPGQSGLVACEKIARDFPDTKIVVLTMFAEPEYLFYTLRGGASGYVLKNSTSEELVAAVRAVVGGGSYIHPKMAALLTKQLSGADGDKDRSYQQLSTRELEDPAAHRQGLHQQGDIGAGVPFREDRGGAPLQDIPEARPEVACRPGGLRPTPQAVGRVAATHALARPCRALLGRPLPGRAGGGTLPPRPRPKARAWVGQASTQAPQAMQSPARTHHVVARSGRGPGWTGRPGRRPCGASQWMQAVAVDT